MDWIRLCKAEDVESGTMQVVDLDAKSFLVLRNLDGSSTVVPPSCPHMTAELCEGFFDGEVLTCAKHLWQWTSKDGRMHGIAEAPLLMYPSRIQGDAIEIAFSHELRYAHEDSAE